MVANLRLIRERSERKPARFLYAAPGPLPQERPIHHLSLIFCWILDIPINEWLLMDTGRIDVEPLLCVLHTTTGVSVYLRRKHHITVRGTLEGFG